VEPIIVQDVGLEVYLPPSSLGTKRDIIDAISQARRTDQTLALHTFDSLHAATEALKKVTRDHKAYIKIDIGGELNYIKDLLHRARGLHERRRIIIDALGAWDEHPLHLVTLMQGFSMVGQPYSHSARHHDHCVALMRNNITPYFASESIHQAISYGKMGYGAVFYEPTIREFLPEFK
jgi:hypothetical protein